MTEGQRILKAMILISSSSVLSVALGFIVQVTLAAFYGASSTMDAYLVAIALPIMLSSVFHSVLTYTLVPLLKTCIVKGQTLDFWRLAATMFATVGGISFVAVIGLVLFADAIIGLLAPGLDSATRKMAVEAFRIIAAGLVFDSLRAVLQTVYLAKDRFFLPQFVLGLFYFVVLACTTLFAYPLGINGVALGWPIGFALIFVLLLIPLARECVRIRFPGHANIKDVPWRALAVGALAVAFFQAAPLIDRGVASGLSAGSISYLGYGSKILDILTRIVPMALGLAIFPRASEYVARNELLKLRLQVQRHVRTAVFICLPLAVTVIILRVPIITLLFERGAFDATATHQVTNVIVWYMIGFVPMSVLTILNYTFYSLRRLTVVVTLGLLYAGLTLLGDMVFSQFWGYVGIAVSNACVTTILAVVAWILLERDNQTEKERSANKVAEGAWLTNIALGTCIMAFTMYLLQLILFPSFSEGIALLADLTVVPSIGAIVYVGTLLMLCNRELIAVSGHIVEWFRFERPVENSQQKESHTTIQNSH